MKSAKAIVSATLAAAAFLACDAGPVEQSGDAQLTLSTDSVVVDLFASSQLTATVLNASGPAQYVSRDRGVATVSANGAISGVGRRRDVRRRHAVGPPGRA